ncbi:MAG: GxxExxY protein [Wenzhouxiangella sp.]
MTEGSRQDAKAPSTPRKSKKTEEDRIAGMIVDSAVAIHRDLGPGLLESVYEALLANKLGRLGLSVMRQQKVPLRYDGIDFLEAFRADLIINNKVIVEIKTVERLSNAHRKQLLTYLKLTGLRLGILLNFSEALMKDGITRIANAAQE